MSDIFDDIKITGTFDHDELIEKLVHRILAQRAEIRTLSSIVADLFAKSNGLTVDQAAKIMAESVKDNARDIFLNDELTAPMHDKRNREQLGLDEGFNSKPD
jgi:hypothetical protein